jgi:hypothetical protein
VQAFFSLFLGSSFFSVVRLPGCLGFRLRLHPDLRTKSLTFRKSKFDPVFAASCRISNLALKEPFKSTSSVYPNCP